MNKAIVIKDYINMILPAYRPYLKDYKTRVNIFYGGAGSGKSKFIVQKMLYKLINDKRKCLVVRKVGATIRESIFAEFKTLISDLGIYNECNINKTDMTIELPNKSIFIFKGLDDSEKVKSIQGIDDIIIEEATELVGNDFTQLNLRLRSKKENQQIHIMFNPVSKVNWVYRLFFKKKYKGALIVKTTYKDNTFLPKDYIESIENLKETNFAMWEIYANGKFASLDKRVFTNWETLEFDIEAVKREEAEIVAKDLGLNVTSLINPRGNPFLKNHFTRKTYFGLDFGYTNDPSAFIVFLVDEKKKLMWIYDEFYRSGMLNEDIYNLIAYKGYSKERIIADSAEPKSIAELRKLGLRRIKSAEKGKDSIIHGIQYLQGYKIYIHPKCVNTIMEFENYTWQKDKKTGEYINKPIDDYCHLIDALRYGAEAIRKGKGIRMLA
ncbi:PBSX family phage terminase large subunit [Clostridium sardiniense]|uniref:PBSX family phage terminase large subunit n=1 Tax=Clostridium sardiniense TaxID=29369 RepID=A0ABS7L2Z9_CLOSR|nr:PBSX family phage terminase large subunit [Clostridium sardiniense]MBY0757441.1 PBSX family phage terminase large subunit [Clostridium sardiniense]MDQ0462186.1 phage terminase large subunit [Clostridium sardiniense]